jgi:cytochrome c oxidase subunit II
MRGRTRRQTAALLVVAAAVLAACASDAPQDSLDPAGPYARTIDNLFRPVFWIAVGVFILVEGLLVAAMIKFRQRPGRTDNVKQVHGNTRLEIAWTIIPALLLAGIAIPTVGTIVDLSRRPSGDVLDITVVGKQWWWAVEYPRLDPPVVTANEIHIPADRPVYLTLKSDDVIHSFWIPRLAGKQDMVPGHDETLLIQADEPGTYLGQCAEFCGTAHWNMRLVVIAHDQAGFEEWVEGQQAEPAAPADELARRGEELFLTGMFPGQDGMTGGQCIACHAPPGTGSLQAVGPDLTHFASRQTFAGNILENTPEDLRRWLADPPEVKPGSLMPDYGLTQEEVDALVAYLTSLE